MRSTRGGGEISPKSEGGSLTNSAELGLTMLRMGRSSRAMSARDHRFRPAASKNAGGTGGRPTPSSVRTNADNFGGETRRFSGAAEPDSVIPRGSCDRFSSPPMFA